MGAATVSGKCIRATLRPTQRFLLRIYCESLQYMHISQTPGTCVSSESSGSARFAAYRPELLSRIGLAGLRFSLQYKRTQYN